MDEFEVQCNDCYWEGFVTDLVSKTCASDDLDFSCCPECLSDDVIDIDI